jgi:hypothetical protein
MGDTFMNWPHGPEKLKVLPDQLIDVHRDIQFTMEAERDDHLPFLDTDN